MTASVDVVTDDSSLAAIWAAWDELWLRVPDATPFTSPAWLRPWWSVFGTGHPIVAVMYGVSGLLAVLPLYRLNDKVLPMGVGISDYFDILLGPEAPSDAASRLVAAALAIGDASRCDIPELPPGAALLCGASPEGWDSEIWTGPMCPVVVLQPQPAIPKGMRRDLRQARNRADRAGGWRVERADSSTVSSHLEQLVNLHTARWTARGEPGVLSDSRVVQFHQAAAPILFNAGLLRLEAVYLNDRVGAVIYGLIAGSRIYLYLAGLNPDCTFESPGTILLGHMLEAACHEGRREAHFLRGSESYKYAWGGINRPNTGRSFVRQ